MKKEVVLFPNSPDGIASAALFCRAQPNGKFDPKITNAPAIVETLLAIKASETETIHILGVGVGKYLDDVTDALKATKLNKKKIIWYCGRGYLDKDKDVLSYNCTTKFETLNSNAEFIAKIFDVKKDEYLKHLLNIAEYYERLPDEKYNGDLPQKWVDLTNSLTETNYEYSSNKDYLKVIKLLALSAEWLTPFYDDLIKVYQDRVASYKILTQGRSKIATNLKKKIKLFSESKEPVLIIGPSGSGKELAAKDIHSLSARSKEPYHPINCADFAGNPDLAKSTLFGHAKGAFTGALNDSPGAFAFCSKGTLFLDEIAELPLQIQTILLRVLETGDYQSLGDTTIKKTDCRIIAATNQDLRQLVIEKKFRLDLFYRVNVLTLTLPTLKERGNDCDAILDEMIKAENKEFILKEEDKTAIAEYSWPGNFRELRNLVRRAIYSDLSLADCINEEKKQPLMEKTIVNAEGIPTQPSIPLPTNEQEIKTEEEFKKLYIKHVYKICGDNCKLTAKKLDVAPNTVKKYVQ